MQASQLIRRRIVVRKIARQRTQTTITLQRINQKRRLPNIPNFVKTRRHAMIIQRVIQLLNVRRDHNSLRQ